MGIAFRPARPEDAEGLRALVSELGQGGAGGEPVTTAELEGRLARLLRAPAHVVLVAEDGPELLGWIHVQESLSLTREPGGLVTGLAVARAARRRGLGRALVAAAEGWLASRGLGGLRVRARHTRAGAHAFYRSLGFERVKEQIQFEKREA